ncbi:TonB-dependent receptor plug domain-containing protein [Massilia aerilata]|uniref:TonB-dependent receptor plug domain-containing protein n=1 Tax=Massilia aerilata TaxID=453817 RepID=A0ABW0RXM8_9BURK
MILKQHRIAAAVQLALLTLPAAALAQTAPAAPAAPAEAVSAKPAKKDAIATVEVKGAAGSYDPRRDDTASKTVMNADEIRKFGDTNVYDVLKRAPGVIVAGKTLRMNGLGNGYTQILVNGDRPPPGFNMDTLTPDQIERIEIIRAASAEYSMQAIAGTINIVLKKVIAKPQRDLRLAYANAPTNHNYSVSGTWGDKAGKLSYFVSAFLYGGDNSNVSTGGASLTLPSGEVTQLRTTRSEGSGSYRGAMLFPRLSWKFDNGDELSASSMLQSSRNGWDGTTHNANLVGSFASPDYVDYTYRSPNSMTMAAGEIGWIAKLAGGKLDLKLSGDRNRNGDEQFNEMFTAGRGQRLLRDWDSVNRGHRATLRGKYTRSLFDGHNLSTGLEGSVQESEQTRDRHDQLNQDAPTRLIETFAPKISRLAGYLQDEWSVDKQFSVYLGARWEGVQTDSEADSGPVGHFSTSSRNHVLSPVAQTLYKFPDGSGRQLRLAYTRTYKAPTVDQLTARRYETAVNTRFAADSGGNPNLRPELANGIDVTFEQFLKSGAMVSASVSRRAISDYIRTTLDVDENGRWVYRPLNDGDALVRTLQLEAKAPGKALSPALGAFDLRASFSRNWSRVSSVPGPGNRLDGQTPMSATAGIDYRKGDLTLGGSMNWQHGGWVKVSEAESQFQQSRRDLDVYLLYKFNPRYQLRVSAYNLLGQDMNSDRIYRDAAGTSRETSFNPQYRRVAANIEMKF